MGLAAHFEPRFIEYAINNLRVKHSGAKASSSTAARIV